MAINTVVLKEILQARNRQLIVTSLSQLSAAVTSINSKQMLSNNVIFHQKMTYVVRKIPVDLLARAAQF